MKYKKETLVFLFYTTLAIIFTYPLVFKISTSIYGYPGDNFSTLWHLWWAKYAITHQLPQRFTPFLNAPYGMDLGVHLNSAVFYSYPLVALSFIFGEVAAFNLVNFLSFPLAGLTMFILVRYLTKSDWAAVLAGLIFSFSPYHFWKSYNHADLASIQWLPLYVLSLIKLFEKRNYRWALFTALSFAVVTLTSFYYGYFMILFTVGFAIVIFLFQSLALKYERARLLKSLKGIILAGILSALFLLPFTVKLFFAASAPQQVVAGRSAGLLRTTTDELLALSSRPWDFLLPSGDHPIFGKYVDQFYGWLARVGNDFKTQSAFAWERNIYLGWVGMLLSLLAVKNFRRNRWILIFAAVALLMIWVSFPAFININGQRLYFPSYFLHNLAPMFRTYVRLGVVVLLCVAVLSGFGLSFIFEKIKSRNLLYFCFLLFAFLILFDFTNIPPFRVTTFAQNPPSYEWLKEQPGDFMIAEYPRPYSEAEAMFFQRIHEKRMIKVSEDLANLYHPQTIGRLKDLGVKYVVVHVRNIFPVDPYNGNREYQVMSPPMETSQLKIAAQFPEALIYEIL